MNGGKEKFLRGLKKEDCLESQNVDRTVILTRYIRTRIIWRVVDLSNSGQRQGVYSYEDGAES
jgi:hypothetical protein